MDPSFISTASGISSQGSMTLQGTPPSFEEVLLNWHVSCYRSILSLRWNTAREREQTAGDSGAGSK